MEMSRLHKAKVEGRKEGRKGERGAGRKRRELKIVAKYHLKQNLLPTQKNLSTEIGKKEKQFFFNYQTIIKQEYNTHHRQIARGCKDRRKSHFSVYLSRYNPLYSFFKMKLLSLLHLHDQKGGLPFGARGQLKLDAFSPRLLAAVFQRHFYL